MAVAFDTSAESHTGTTGNTSSASFDFNITPASGVKGLLVFTFTNANADDATSVKINPAGANIDVPAVSGGRAVDTAGEPGDCKAWFLGDADLLPAGGAQWTIRVNRNNNANEMYAVAISVAANGNTKVNTANITLQQTDGTCAEVSVTDGVDTRGINSVRFAAINSGLSGIVDNPGTPGTNNLSRGTNSTVAQSIDYGSRVTMVVRETTAGSGSRSVGFSATTSDDRAAVHLAVYEALTVPKGSLAASGVAAALFLAVAAAVPAGAITLTGQTVGVAFTGPDAGAVTYAGQAPTVFVDKALALPAGSIVLTGEAPTVATAGEVTIEVPEASVAATGQAELLAFSILPDLGALAVIGQDLGVAFTGPDVGALALTGLEPTVNVESGLTLPIPAGSLALTGTANTLAFLADLPAASVALDGQAEVLAFSMPPGLGSLALTGEAPTVVVGNPIAVPDGSVALTGEAEALAFSIQASAGAAVLTGAAPTLAVGLLIEVPAGSALAEGLYIGVTFESPAAGTVTLTGLAPSLVPGGSIAPPAGAIALTGEAETLAFLLAGNVGAITLAGSAPNIGGGTVLDLPVGTLALDGQAPTLAVVVALQAGAVVSSGQTPARLVDDPTAMQAGALTATGLAEVLASGLRLDVGSVVFVGEAPFTGGGTRIGPPAGALACAGLAPTLRTDIALSAGSVALDGQAPLAVVTVPIAMPAGSLTCAGLTSTQALGLALPRGTVVLTGLAPTAGGTNSIAVPEGALACTGLAPQIFIDAPFALPAAELLLEGLAPSLGFVVPMPGGSLACLGYALEANAPVDAFATTFIKVAARPRIVKVEAVARLVQVRPNPREVKVE